MRLMDTFSFLRTLVVALVLAALLPAHAARADDDPFSFDSSNWTSFKRYKEDPDAWKKQQEENKAAAVAPPPVLAPQPVIPPIRPVIEPVMPGLNSGFDVKVDSMGDEATSASHLTHLE